MRRMVAVVLLTTLALFGFNGSADAGVIATTDVRHTLTLDSVDIVPSGTFLVTPTITAFNPLEVVETNFNGEGSTGASGSVSVNNQQISLPSEIPALAENGSIVIDLAALAERSSSGVSFARASAQYQLEFQNLSGADATFHLSYVSEVSASVLGADTLFSTSSGFSNGFGAVIDDGSLVGDPFVNQVLDPTIPFPLTSVDAVRNGHTVSSFIDGNTTISSTMTQSFSFTIAGGDSATFSLEGLAFAGASATVPEPGSLAIWATGVLLLTRRRRTR